MDLQTCANFAYVFATTMPVGMAPKTSNYLLVQEKESVMASQLGHAGKALEQETVAIGSSLQLLGDNGVSALPGIQESVSQQGKLLAAFSEVRGSPCNLTETFNCFGGT